MEGSQETFAARLGSAFSVAVIGHQRPSANPLTGAKYKHFHFVSGHSTRKYQISLCAQIFIDTHCFPCTTTLVSIKDPPPLRMYSRVRNRLQFPLSMILFLTHILCGTCSPDSRPLHSLTSLFWMSRDSA